MLSHTTNFSRTQTLGKNVRFVPSAASHSLNGTLDMMGAPMSFARNSEIYGENEPAEYPLQARQRRRADLQDPE